MNFKDYLKQSRQQNNLTQKQAAKKIGTAECTIQNWENGRSMPEKALFPSIIQTYYLDKYEFGKYYINQIMSEIEDVETKPDKMFLLMDEKGEDLEKYKFEHIYILNPYLTNSNLIFNPMKGSIDSVINALSAALISNNDNEFIRNENLQVLNNAIIVLKHLLQDNATIFDLQKILWNIQDIGRKKYVMKLRKINTNLSRNINELEIRRKNDELIDWFLNDYYAGIGGAKGAPKTYQNATNLRYNLDKFIENTYYNKMFAKRNDKEEIVKEVKKIPFPIEEDNQCTKYTEDVVHFKFGDITTENFDLYQLPSNSLVVFQCISKEESFYKLIAAMLDTLELQFKIQKMNGTLSEHIFIKKK